MYHTPKYCRLREYTNVVAACWHSIVKNAHTLLDVVGRCALIQVSTLCCYFEVTLGYLKNQVKGD